MKTFLISFSLTLLLAFSTSAQSKLSKGNIFLGGALQVSSSVLDIGGGISQNSFNYQVAPKFGYFTSDKFVVGGSVGIRGRKFADEMENSLVIMPFIRNYFTRNERVGLYGGASLPITLINDESAGLNITAGVTFFATEKIALEARTNLVSISVPFDGYFVKYKFGLNTNSVGLGFLFFL